MRRQALLGLAGWSGSGKTQLACQLIAHLTQAGRRVSTVKHAHHAFDMDVPGKDSYQHRAAGAGQVLVTSAQRWALMTELRHADELTLDQALSRLAPCDLVIVEGFKQVDFPKLEVHRPSLKKPLLYGTVPGIRAVASDEALPDLDPSVPFLDLNQTATIARWVAAQAAWSS